MKAQLIVTAALITMAGSAAPPPAQTQMEMKLSPYFQSNLYFQSIGACLQARSEDYKNSDTSRGDGSAIVLYDDAIMRTFPTSIGAFQVEYLDGAALRRRHAQLNADFPVVGIGPAEIGRSLIVVRCSIFRAQMQTRTLVRRRLVLGVFGGWDVQWKYDCASGKYVIGDVKKWWFQM